MKFIGILFIVVLSCNAPKKDENTQERTEKSQTEYLSKKEVILTKSERNLWLKERHGYEMWEPSPNDIEKMKSIINDAIINDEFSFLNKPISQSINEYYRQYVPYINEKGERMFEVNAFCEILELPPHPDSLSKKWTKQDWRNEMVIVDDGGICYWQMKANIETNEYSDLYANGPG
ncbi:hypothetical protein [Patiriisocius marinus]|uniref:hypothetical protein n=1 Tax=Patiriisocius marinus TaxID=1397112 RepID=UPI0023309B7B|nr:hypothetical protein [Patiriisocius marinus]